MTVRVRRTCPYVPDDATGRGRAAGQGLLPRGRAATASWTQPDVPRALGRAGRTAIAGRPDADLVLPRPRDADPLPGPGMDPVEERLFMLLAAGGLSATAYFQIPPDRVVELGTQVEIDAPRPPGDRASRAGRGVGGPSMSFGSLENLGRELAECRRLGRVDSRGWSGSPRRRRRRPSGTRRSRPTQQPPRLPGRGDQRPGAAPPRLRGAGLGAPAGGRGPARRDELPPAAGRDRRRLRARLRDGAAVPARRRGVLARVGQRDRPARPSTSAVLAVAARLQRPLDPSPTARLGLVAPHGCPTARSEAARHRHAPRHPTLINGPLGGRDGTRQHHHRPPG